MMGWFTPTPILKGALNILKLVNIIQIFKLLEIGDSIFAQFFQAKQPDRQYFNHVSIFSILTPSQDQGTIMSLVNGPR